MFIMTTATYPPEKSVAVAKKFTAASAKPLPAFIKRLHVLITARGDLGMKAYGIYEVNDAKLKDAMIELTKYFVQFIDIEGFRYEIEPMLTAQEAIPLVL